MTEAEEREICVLATQQHLQAVTDSLWLRGGKSPSGLVLEINPACDRRMRFFRVSNRYGAWSDLDTQDANGPDLISLVEYYIGPGRQRAAKFLQAVIARAAPLVPHDLPSEPAPAHVARQGQQPSVRSLRRMT